MTKPIQFTDANFESEVLESSQPVLVDFWAEWCGPCHLLTPTIEELASDLGETVKVGKLNVDENAQTAARYRVRAARWRPCHQPTEANVTRSSTSSGITSMVPDLAEATT